MESPSPSSSTSATNGLSTTWSRKARSYHPSDTLPTSSQQPSCKSSNRAIQHSRKAHTCPSSSHRQRVSDAPEPNQLPRVHKMQQPKPDANRRFPNGSTFNKVFDDATFTGTVVGFDDAEGFYEISYSDGDSEELTEDELVTLINECNKAALTYRTNSSKKKHKSKKTRPGKKNNDRQKQQRRSKRKQQRKANAAQQIDSEYVGGGYISSNKRNHWDGIQ